MDGRKREQRRFKRCPLDTVAGISRFGEFVFENSIEVSEGGMLVSASGKYQVGDSVDIFFFVPSGKFVKVSGEVAYLLNRGTGSCNVGLRFTDPSDACKATIREYVNDATL